MKKSLLALLVAIMVLGLTGCDEADQFVEDCKEQAEWTAENGALTNGRSSQEQLEETLGDLSGMDISLEDEDNSTTSSGGNEHELGETISVTYTDDYGTLSYLDITVTGYQVVNNGRKNVTAISYTITNTSGDEMIFDNSLFTCYADNNYVDTESWGDYNTFSYGKLMSGTSYEGCYVADVDGNTVSTIDLYIGDFVYHVQKEEILNVESNPDYDSEKGLSLAGLYSDGNDSLDVSFYSAADGWYVGSFTTTMDGVSYSGELQYELGPDCYTYYGDLLTICMWFENGSVQVYVDGNSVNYWSSYMPMVQHYES